MSYECAARQPPLEQNLIDATGIEFGRFEQAAATSATAAAGVVQTPIGEMRIANLPRA
jgi:hypothetical protein